jgi:cytoskeletal protein RodZ
VKKLGDKGARGRKRVFGFIAITLVVCFGLAVFLSLALSRQTPVEAQNDAQPQTTIQPNPTTNNNESNASVNSTPKPSENSVTPTPNDRTWPYTRNSVTPSPTPTPQNNSLITEEQAKQIAMPLIQQYANEHNRTITTVNATFYSNFKANSFPPSQQSVTFPGWLINAGYVRAPQDSGEQYWILGYQVIVRADTGQVYSSNVAGIM